MLSRNRLPIPVQSAVLTIRVRLGRNRLKSHHTPIRTYDGKHWPRQGFHEIYGEICRAGEEREIS